MTHAMLFRAALTFAALALQSTEASAQFPPGSFDPSWGHSGRAFIDLGAPTSFQPAASALQADGKLVVGGNLDPANCGGIAFTRLNLDGTLDTTFGTGGWYNLSTSPYCAGEP